MKSILIIGAFISAMSVLPYARGVLRGEVRPKLVSWFSWCLLALLLTGAGLSTGQMMSAVMSAVTVLTTGIILILGFKAGSKNLDKLDIVSLVGAGIGMVIWLMLDNPELAIYVAVAVDIVAFVPTLVHGWVAPEEESLSAYALASIGSGLGLATIIISGATISGLAYPIYSTLFNGFMVILLVRSFAWFAPLSSWWKTVKKENAYAE